MPRLQTIDDPSILLWLLSFFLLCWCSSLGFFGALGQRLDRVKGQVRLAGRPRRAAIFFVQKKRSSPSNKLIGALSLFRAKKITKL
jgi:hypothetical protein